MLPGGHIAVSYLLAQIPQNFGVSLNNSEVISVLIAGNIPDLDFIVGLFNKKSGEAHHQNITHTPLGIIIIWILMIVFLRPSILLSVLFLAALLSHLVLDDISYWAYKLKIQKFKVNPQINWLYPIKPYSKHDLVTENKEVFKNYLFKIWLISVLECLLIIVALVVFLW